MLSKRCPFTGIINFYSDVDPHLAVGSIARDVARAKSAGPRPAGFTWRCYTDDSMTGGIAPDLQTAERRLVNFLSLVETSRPGLAAQVA